MEKAHLPPGSFRRLGDEACRIPYPNVPVVSLARFQRRAVIDNSNRLRGINFAAVPDAGLPGLQALIIAGYQNLVSRLSPVALGTIALPRQMRNHRVNSQRIFEVIAAQMDRRSGRE